MNSVPVSKNIPVLSVIVITYNHEKYIRQCITSILEQKTDFRFEIIIADDFSKDKTREICKELENKHSEKVRLLFQKQNVGLMKNYLSVLKLCKGKYIAQIAGDDYFTDPEKLQKQKDYLQAHPEVGLVFTDCDFFYERTGVTERSVFSTGTKRYTKSFEEHIAEKGFLAPMTWMYRAELSPLSFGYVQDYTDESFPYILDIFKHSNIHFLQQSTAVRRVQENSISHQSDSQRKFAYMKGVFDIQKEYAEKYKITPALKDVVFSKSYIQLLPLALQTEQKIFLEEAKNFFEAKNISYNALLALCNSYIYQQKLSGNAINKMYLKMRKYF